MNLPYSPSSIKTKFPLEIQQSRWLWIPFTIAVGLLVLSVLACLIFAGNSLVLFNYLWSANGKSMGPYASQAIVYFAIGIASFHLSYKLFTFVEKRYQGSNLFF